MKVKIGELKTHLSRYVQSVRDGEDPIEVCVRDQVVAYLTPANRETSRESPRQSDLAQRLERKGLQLKNLGRVSDRILEPGVPTDGQKIKNSVVAIRAQKDW